MPCVIWTNSCHSTCSYFHYCSVVSFHSHNLLQIFWGMPCVSIRRVEENHISPSRKGMKGTSYLWGFFWVIFSPSDSSSCRAEGCSCKEGCQCGSLWRRVKGVWKSCWKRTSVMRVLQTGKDFRKERPLKYYLGSATLAKLTTSL